MTSYTKNKEYSKKEYCLVPVRINDTYYELWPATNKIEHVVQTETKSKKSKNKITKCSFKYFMSNLNQFLTYYITYLSSKLHSIGNKHIYCINLERFDFVHNRVVRDIAMLVYGRKEKGMRARSSICISFHFLHAPAFFCIQNHTRAFICA